MFPGFYAVDLFESMKVDFQSKMEPALSRDRNHRLISPKILYTDGQPVIMIKNLVDSIDINQLSILSECVKSSFPKQFLNRSFDSSLRYVEGELSESEDDGAAGGFAGGNSVIFIEGFIQKIMPEFVEYIMSSLTEATSKANWHPYPRHLGLRCIESLRYFSGGELSYHTDSESIFTIVIMLSDPLNAFTGGDFVIKSKFKNNEEILRIAPSLGDAIVFDSCTMHGVDSIVSGERNVLVIELWPYEDSDQGDRRPGSERYKHRFKIPKLIMR